MLAMNVALPHRARAEPPTSASVSDADVERAAALKRRADEAMDALRYGDALAAYRQAYELTRNPALLYNQARAHQALGDFASSLEFLERFDAEAPAALKAKVPQLTQLTEEVRARTARLTVRCNIAGAEVVLNDRIIGATPIGREIKTSSGRVTLKVSAEGYQPFRKELDLPGGGATAVEVELLSKDASGILVVRSNAAGASVALDGKAVGQVPQELSVRAGSHALRVERSGFEPSQISVIVRVGERKEVDVSLVQPPPITAKWWFWTGIGLAVVGGVALTIALTSERSPDQGSITPGRLSAPLLRW